MIKNIPFLSVLLISSLFTLGSARADEALEEVPIAGAYLPAHGFDDNDNVEVMLDIILPDPCYTLSAPDFKKTLSGNKIELKAYAWRRHDGACNTSNLLEPSNVSVVQNLGRLTNGNYSIATRDENGVESRKIFEVALAKTTTIDDLSYAQVTNIIVREFFAASEKISATVTGRYNPSCETVDKKIVFRVDGDTIIAMPTTTKIPGTKCGARLAQFDRTIAVGKLKPGAYLFHARSKNGTSVSHLFHVLSR